LPTSPHRSQKPHHESCFDRRFSIRG
jgi:hypothetical protein